MVHWSESKRKKREAKREDALTDGTVLSGVQRPAEKDLLHRGRETRMEAYPESGRDRKRNRRLWESFRRGHSKWKKNLEKETRTGKGGTHSRTLGGVGGDGRRG